MNGPVQCFAVVRTVWSLAGRAERAMWAAHHKNLVFALAGRAARGQICFATACEPARTPDSPRGSGDEEADHTEDDRSHCRRPAKTYVRYTVYNFAQMYGHDIVTTP